MGTYSFIFYLIRCVEEGTIFIDIEAGKPPENNYRSVREDLKNHVFPLIRLSLY